MIQRFCNKQAGQKAKVQPSDIDLMYKQGKTKMRKIASGISVREGKMKYANPPRVVRKDLIERVSNLKC